MRDDATVECVWVKFGREKASLSLLVLPTAQRYVAFGKAFDGRVHEGHSKCDVPSCRGTSIVRRGAPGPPRVRSRRQSLYRHTGAARQDRGGGCLAPRRVSSPHTAVSPCVPVPRLVVIVGFFIQANAPHNSTSYAQWRGWMDVVGALRRRHPEMVVDHRLSAHALGPWYQEAGSYSEPIAGDENPETYGIQVGVSRRVVGRWLAGCC